MTHTMPPGSRTKPPNSVTAHEYALLRSRHVAPLSQAAMVSGSPPRRRGRALQQAQFGLGLPPRREHQRVVTVRDLEPFDLQTEAEAHVVEGNAPVLEPEILERAADGGSHVESIGRARLGDPRCSRPI